MVSGCMDGHLCMESHATGTGCASPAWIPNIPPIPAAGSAVVKVGVGGIFIGCGMFLVGRDPQGLSQYSPENFGKCSGRHP